jgi:hypothetical protein
MKMVVTDTPDPENHVHTMSVSSIYIMIIIRHCGVMINLKNL